MGAATHRSAAARAVHCGARSLLSELSGGSHLRSPLHFPEGYATPSASPCSNLVAEASPPWRIRLQSGAGDSGVSELSPAPRGGDGAQARAAGQARWILAGGWGPLFCPRSRSRCEAGRGGGAAQSLKNQRAPHHCIRRGASSAACGSSESSLSPVSSRVCLWRFSLKRRKIPSSSYLSFPSQIRLYPVQKQKPKKLHLIMVISTMHKNRIV